MPKLKIGQLKQKPQLLVQKYDFSKQGVVSEDYAEDLRKMQDTMKEIQRLE